jgi:hypothetical protein
LVFSLLVGGVGPSRGGLLIEVGLQCETACLLGAEVAAGPYFLLVRSGPAQERDFVGDAILLVDDLRIAAVVFSIRRRRRGKVGRVRNDRVWKRRRSKPRRNGCSARRLCSTIVPVGRGWARGRSARLRSSGAMGCRSGFGAKCRWRQARRCHQENAHSAGDAFVVVVHGGSPYVREQKRCCRPGADRLAPQLLTPLGGLTSQKSRGVPCSICAALTSTC